MLRDDSLLKVIIEGRIEVKKTRRRKRMMSLDWMMNVDCNKLKERESWTLWRMVSLEPAACLGGQITKKKKLT